MPVPSRRPNLQAALGKAGVNKSLFFTADPKRLSTIGLFTPEMKYKQTILELLDGTLTKTVAQLIHGALVTGKTIHSPRFRWAQILAEANITPQDLIYGVRYGDIEQGLSIESWWTHREDGKGLGTFNLRVFHDKATLWDSLFEEDVVARISDQQRQGVSLQIRMLKDSQQLSTRPVLLCLVQDAGIIGTTEFSHQVDGLVPAIAYPGLQPSIDQLFEHLFDRQSCSRADFLVPDKHLWPLVPPGFSETSLCLFGYEHLDQKALIEKFKESPFGKPFVTAFRTKNAILLCQKPSIRWERFVIGEIEATDKVTPREIILPAALTIKNTNEFSGIASLVLDEQGSRITVGAEELIAPYFEQDGVDLNILSKRVDGIVQEILTPNADGKNIDKLEQLYWEERQKRTSLEECVQTLNTHLALSRGSEENTQVKINQFEKLFEVMRRYLGAGKGSSIEDIPKRVAELSAQLSDSEIKVQDSLESANNLRAENDKLRLIVEKQAEELQNAAIENELIPSNKRMHDHVIASSNTFSEGGEVVPSYFSSFCSIDSFKSVKERYAAWVLGLNGYEPLRQFRMEAGVEISWSLQNLFAPTPINLQAARGVSIAIRESLGTWILRFIHPDARFEGNAWWNLIRLSETQDGTRIEHALIRFTGAHVQRPGPQDIPQVLKDLFRTVNYPRFWENFQAGPIELTSDNINIVVTQVLINPERDLPVVIISRSAQNEELLVDPHELSNALQGMAVVCYLSEGDGYLLSNALRTVSVDSRRLSCWDGGVRVYLPAFAPDSDPYRHALWIRAYLEQKSPRERIQLIGQKVAAHAVGLRVPSGFTRLIEDHDLNAAAEETFRLAKSGKMSEQIAALKAQIKLLQEVNDGLRCESEQIIAIRNKDLYLETLIEEFDRERKIATSEAEDYRQRVGKLQLQLDIAGQAQEPTEVIDLPHELLDGIIENKWNVYGTLVRLFQVRYRDRVVFLPEALSSADECTFKYEDKATDVLHNLVTKYYDALLVGKGDQVGRRVFGKDGFAPKESQNLSSSGVKARTRFFEGKNWIMESHLKITKGEEHSTSNMVFRVYFYWDGQEKRILVGHVGKHLPL